MGEGVRVLYFGEQLGKGEIHTTKQKGRGEENNPQRDERHPPLNNNNKKKSKRTGTSRLKDLVHALGTERGLDHIAQRNRSEERRPAGLW